MFMFASTRGIISSAVRLNAIGPLEAQRVQAHSYKVCQCVLQENVERSVEEACQVRFCFQNKFIYLFLL